MYEKKYVSLPQNDLKQQNYEEKTIYDDVCLADYHFGWVQ